VTQDRFLRSQPMDRPNMSVVSTENLFHLNRISELILLVTAEEVKSIKKFTDERTDLLGERSTQKRSH
jgi:hypothetical protein